MNDEKIVNRVNPTDNEDAETKKYVDEKKNKTKQKKKQKQSIYSLFCQNMPPKSHHRCIHQRKSNVLVSHRPRLKQWTTSFQKL